MVNCETNANGSIPPKNEQGTKKKSKQKRTTLNFNEYVKRVSGPGPLPMLSIRRSRLDELNVDLAESTRLALSRIVLPTAPKSSCKIDIDDSKLPSEPPFVINISNLPYEFEDEELHAVFDHIVHIDVTRDDSKKSKGYARVELETKEALVNALNLTEVLLRGRRLRVDLYEAHGSRRGYDGGGHSHDDYHRRFGSGGFGGGGGGGSNEMNWRSGLSSRQVVNLTAPVSAGGSSGGGGGGGSWRDSQSRPTSMSNESSSSTSSMHARNFNKYSFRGQHKDSNNTNSTTSATNTTTDDALNYNWRQNNSSNNFGDSKFTNSSSNNGETGSNERPKLKLCPRTKPLLNVEGVVTTTATATAENAANENLRNSSESLSERATSAVRNETESATLAQQPKKNKPSIFGNAKPVDTATKERQIEIQLLENRARTTAALTVAVTPNDDSSSSETAAVSPPPQPQPTISPVVDSSNSSISPSATSISSISNDGDPHQQPNKKLYRPPNRRNN